MTDQVIEALRKVLPDDKSFTPLHEPHFAGNEWKYVKQCIDTGWVSSVGEYVNLFEQKLAEFTGAKHAVAVVNGTAALHVCLQLVGVEPGNEVLIPALTFVATANAVSYCGAVPHFVDSEWRTLGIDPYKLGSYLDEVAEMRGRECYNRNTGRRIKAVVPMHTFGHPVDMDPLVKLCERWGLELVEDAAESLGSYYKGTHTGRFGQCAAFSFNGNKIITTGGGGAIITDNEELAKKAKHLTTTAKVPHRWAFEHDMIGYNYRMPNLNAALGCAQLEQLPDFLEKKRKLAKKYEGILNNVEGISFFREPEFAKSNYWLNVLVIKKNDELLRDVILSMTNRDGIMTRPIWTLMSKLDIYRDYPRMALDTAYYIEESVINIPSSANLNID